MVKLHLLMSSRYLRRYEELNRFPEHSRVHKDGIVFCP